MTIEEIEQTLPNGLHDAQIKQMRWDFERATLDLDVDVLVSLPGGSPPRADEYRPAKLAFASVYFVSCDYPQRDAPFLGSGTLWFSYERTPTERLPAGLSARLPAGALCYSFFIQQWLSELHVAVGEVTLSWVGV